MSARVIVVHCCEMRGSMQTVHTRCGGRATGGWVASNRQEVLLRWIRWIHIEVVHVIREQCAHHHAWPGQICPVEVRLQQIDAQVRSLLVEPARLQHVVECDATVALHALWIKKLVVLHLQGR